MNQICLSAKNIAYNIIDHMSSSFEKRYLGFDQCDLFLERMKNFLKINPGVFVVSEKGGLGG